MTGYSVEYLDGDWTALKAEFQNTDETLNGYEEATFKIANTAANRALVASNLDAQIKFDGTVIFSGELSALEYENRKILCIVYNKVYEAMKRKTVTGTYEDTAADTVLAAICTAAGVTDGDCPSTHVSVRFERCDCYSAATWLAKAVTKDFYSSSGTTFNIGDRGSAKSLDNAKISVSNRGLDRSKKRDKIYIRGCDENGVRVYGEAGAGANVAVFNDKKASDEATLDALAATKLAELNTDDSGITISAKITLAAELYPGDTLTITKPRLNLDGSYRIKRIVKSRISAQIDLNTSKKLLEELIDSMQMENEELGIYPLINEQLDNPVGAPAAITDLAATAEISGVRLTWTSNTENDLAGYIIYRNTSLHPTTEYMRVNSNQVLDKNITYGVTYYYRVKPFDRAGNVGSYSNEVSVAPKKVESADITDASVVAAALAKGVQPYNSDVLFSPYTGAETSRVSWAAGTVNFADGTTQAINAGSSGTLTAGVIYYVYFTVGSATMSVTSTYADAVGNTKGILAMIGRSATTQPVLILPFMAKGININADAIVANVAVLNKIWADVVTGKTLQTAASGARAVMSSSGLQIFGQILNFYDASSNQVGGIAATDSTTLTIGANASGASLKLGADVAVEILSNLICDALLTVGSRPASNTESFSCSGAGAGYNFDDRAGYASKGRWVWYATAGAAYLYSSQIADNAIAIDASGHATFTHRLTSLDALSGASLKIGATEIVSSSRALANITTATFTATQDQIKMPSSITWAAKHSETKAFGIWNGSSWLAYFGEDGNLWISGKLTQAGCLPNDLPLSEVWKYLKSVQGKHTNRETQTEVDAVQRVQFDQEKRLTQLETLVAEQAKIIAELKAVSAS
ncbi:MAG: hypothetical protein ACQCN6_01600 [Candidatus Bathyarchaeia archaeon]|jgi:hypothetical protein